MRSIKLICYLLCYYR